ncbi:MAG: N-acetylneuraminate synthase [Thermoanaerobaculaceae bacterium]|nr:N-acetylneuraminate synthase [Thermoanaerobaculaceae bacterium]
MVEIVINKRKIGNGHPCFIIAEAGVNHNGKLGLAFKLVDAAKDSGADAVKFQTFKAENLVLKGAPQANYQKKNAKFKDQYEMIKSLELKFQDFVKIKERCDKRNIIFLSTPFDEESATFLNQINVPAFKIGSGDFNNLPLLKEIVKFGKPLILSSGMSDLKEVKKVIGKLKQIGLKKMALLHCVSSYPAPYSDVNLNVVKKFKSLFDFPIGFSDHTLGVHIPIAAVSLGANIIEKHFTLDRKMEGPDHKASLQPEELKEMVKMLRDVESALGEAKKKIVSSEENTLQVARKSLVAKVNIKKGERIKRDMVVSKRPFGGIDPMMIDKLIGKIAKIDIKKDHILKWEYFR